MSDILDNSEGFETNKMTSKGLGPKHMITYSNNQVLKSEKPTFQNHQNKQI